MKAKLCNHFLKTVKIRLIDRPFWKKLVKIDELCECRKHEIYEGKKIRKFGRERSWQKLTKCGMQEILKKQRLSEKN